jgi:phospholipid N-methyltransferase
MPSNIDKSFIDNLQNFTDSLESLVELFKQQQEKGDAINQLAGALDGDVLSTIAEDMKTLIKQNDKIDSRTKEILAEVKKSRKAKETGIFGNISDKDNKKQVVDGIKVILLIAVGVLAIGMAFKLIGDVNPLTVITLGIAIYAISKAFEAIGKIKGLDKKKALLISGIMVIMAGAIFISSYILKFTASIDIFTAFSIILIGASLGIATALILKFMSMTKVTPKTIVNAMIIGAIFPIIALAIVASSWILKLTAVISVGQALTALFVGATMGIIAYALLQSLSKIDLTNKKTLTAVALSPFILPIIALAVVASSFVLTLIKPLTTQQALGAVLIGASLGIAAFVLLSSLTKINLTDTKTLLAITLSPFILPLIALAIVASSYVLQNFKPIAEPWKMIGSSLAIGLSLLAFFPAIMLASKVGIKEALLGTLVTVAIAVAIMASSWILSVGKYDNYPDWKWSLGVGLSLVAFSLPIIVLGIIATSGIGIAAIGLGILAVMAVSAGIVAVSYILGAGKYDKYPSFKWAAGVGLSLLGFSTAAIVLGAIAMTGVGALVILAGLGMMAAVAQSIVDVSKILNKGTFTGGPTKEWAEGVGTALSTFAIAMDKGMGAGKSLVQKLFGGGGVSSEDFVNFIKSVSAGINEARISLSSGSYSNYPSKEWAEGVGIAIGAFANVLNTVMNSGKGLFQKIFGGGGIKPEEFSAFISSVSNGIVTAAKMFNGTTFSGGPTQEWATSVTNSLLPFIKIYALSQSLTQTDTFASIVENSAKAMVKASEWFAKGNWSTYPTTEWTNGVSKALGVMISISKYAGETEIDSINNFAKAVKNLSSSFESLNASGISKLGSLTASVTLLSSIDTNQLTRILGTLSNNKEELSNMTDEINKVSMKAPLNQGNVNKQAQPLVETNKNGNNNLNTLTYSDQEIVTRMDTVITKFDRVIEKLTINKEGKNAGTFDKPNAIFG